LSRTQRIKSRLSLGSKRFNIFANCIDCSLCGGSQIRDGFRYRADGRLKILTLLDAGGNLSLLRGRQIIEGGLRSRAKVGHLGSKVCHRLRRSQIRGRVGDRGLNLRRGRRCRQRRQGGVDDVLNLLCCQARVCGHRGVDERLHLLGGQSSSRAGSRTGRRTSRRPGSCSGSCPRSGAGGRACRCARGGASRCASRGAGSRPGCGARRCASGRSGCRASSRAGGRARSTGSGRGSSGSRAAGRSRGASSGSTASGGGRGATHGGSAPSGGRSPGKRGCGSSRSASGGCPTGGRTGPGDGCTAAGSCRPAGGGSPTRDRAGRGRCGAGSCACAAAGQSGRAASGRGVAGVGARGGRSTSPGGCGVACGRAGAGVCRAAGVGGHGSGGGAGGLAASGHAVGSAWRDDRIERVVDRCGVDAATSQGGIDLSPEHISAHLAGQAVLDRRQHGVDLSLIQPSGSEAVGQVLVEHPIHHLAGQRVGASTSGPEVLEHIGGAIFDRADSNTAIADGVLNPLGDLIDVVLLNAEGLVYLIERWQGRVERGLAGIGRERVGGVGRIPQVLQGSTSRSGNTNRSRGRDCGVPQGIQVVLEGGILAKTHRQILIGSHLGRGGEQFGDLLVAKTHAEILHGVDDLTHIPGDRDALHEFAHARHTNSLASDLKGGHHRRADAVLLGGQLRVSEDAVLTGLFGAVPSAALAVNDSRSALNPCVVGRDTTKGRNRAHRASQGPRKGGGDA